MEQIDNMIHNVMQQLQIARPVTVSVKPLSVCYYENVIIFRTLLPLYLLHMMAGEYFFFYPLLLFLF